MFQGFKKATPYGGARKLRLTLPPVCRVKYHNYGGNEVSPKIRHLQPNFKIRSIKILQGEGKIATHILFSRSSVEQNRIDFCVKLPSKNLNLKKNYLHS